LRAHSCGAALAFPIKPVLALAQHPSGSLLYVDAADGLDAACRSLLIRQTEILGQLVHVPNRAEFRSLIDDCDCLGFAKAALNPWRSVSGRKDRERPVHFRKCEHDRVHLVVGLGIVPYPRDKPSASVICGHRANKASMSDDLTSTEGVQIKIMVAPTPWRWYTFHCFVP